jgi:hypothetical protein
MYEISVYDEYGHLLIVIPVAKKGSVEYTFGDRVQVAMKRIKVKYIPEKDAV